jgi:hypothetical protein
MKAIVCETPNQLKLVKTDVPALRPGEALVKIRRIGVCGTDLHAYRGRQPYFSYPRILGHELSGEVAEVRAEGCDVQAGDRVAIIPYLHCGRCAACRKGKTNCCERLEVLGVHRDGGMQEYVAVPVTHLLRADSISLDAAAIAECLSIGAHAVARAELAAGDVAVVLGAGPIGLGVMKFLRLRGIEVIAADVNPDRLAFSRSWAGVGATLHVRESIDPVEGVRGLTGGDLASAVFDATGNAASMERSFDYAAHGGKVIFVSLVKGTVSIHDPDFHKKEMTLLSSRNATPEDFRTVLRAMEAGQIDAERFITHRSAFDQAAYEFESWLKPENRVIKAMIEL